MIELILNSQDHISHYSSSIDVMINKERSSTTGKRRIARLDANTEYIMGVRCFLKRLKANSNRVKHLPALMSQV